MIDRCGFQRIAASAIIGVSGTPILICGFTILSGGTAAVPYFNNGTASSGALGLRGEGAANISKATPLNLPVMFPNGCYVSFDANTTEVTVFYILQSTTVSA